MGEPHKFHLFNCDRVYKLDSIEQLLVATKAKLGFEFSVEKHYFSLSRINELSDQTIPKLQMDFAVLAVHANESRLSINEDMEYGYTKVYRALLQSTGGNVIIVIGGDDNYKNEDEENRVVISHWARRKVGFQFKEEFLDGTKSFIFSWNKKPREIHEEALLHYFDPSKKGQKFEHQPHQRNLPSNPAIAAPKGVTTDHERELWENKAEKPLSRKNVAQEEREDASLSSSRPTSSARGKAEEGAQPVKKVSFLSNEGRQLEDLAILGCNISADSMQAVSRVIEDLGPRLNMSTAPPVKNSSPGDIKSYLMRNPIRFCVLVVDAETLRNACDYSPERKVELEDLLRTAAAEVVEKVIFTICGPCPLPRSREEIFEQTIEGILKEKEKGLTVWLEDGKLNVEPDVLIQLMLQTSTMEDTETRKSYLGESSKPTNGASASISDASQSQQPGDRMTNPPVLEPYHDPDVHLDEEYKVQPPKVRQLPAAPNCEGLDANEALVLKTRIRYGKISFAPEDLEFLYPDWETPLHIVASLEREYSAISNGELCIISDEKGNLRCKVQFGRMATCLLV